MKRVQKPVVCDVKGRYPRLEAVGPLRAACDGSALFTYDLQQLFEQVHQRVTGADTEAGGNKFFVVNELAAVIARDTGKGEGLQLGSQFILRQNTDVLVG
jgi:hypothetical protein